MTTLLLESFWIRNLSTFFLVCPLSLKVNFCKCMYCFPSKFEIKWSVEMSIARSIIWLSNWNLSQLDLAPFLKKEMIWFEITDCKGALCLFLSGGFTNMAVINQPEKKLKKCISVESWEPAWKSNWNWIPWEFVMIHKSSNATPENIDTHFSTLYVMQWPPWCLVTEQNLVLGKNIKNIVW